jgi:hypothetical protein
VNINNATFGAATNNQLAIGLDNRYNTGFSKQSMYDIRIYNRPLSSTERTALLSHEIITSGLVLLYKGDEGSGTIAYDSAGYENH